MLQTGDLWNGAEALVVPVGASSEELRYHKSIALQVWLYGYELPGKQCSSYCCHIMLLYYAAAHLQADLCRDVQILLCCSPRRICMF